jgi:hypothetical protein
LNREWSRSVSAESLAALDHLQWLRTGSRAGEALNCSQSRICRAAKRCEEVLQIQLTKVDSEWITTGDTTLLAAERHVHQHCRWIKAQPLRLDGHPALLHELNALKPLGWCCGNLDNTCDANSEYQLTIQRGFTRHHRAQALADHLSENLGRAVTIIEAIN